MIRRLIILLLIVGCVFADTIVIKKSALISDTLYSVEIISKINEEICYRNSDKLFEEHCLDCWRVIEMLDSSNNIIEFDCQKKMQMDNFLTTIKGFIFEPKKYKTLQKVIMPVAVVYIFVNYIVPNLKPVKY